MSVDIGPKVTVTVVAEMTLEIHPYNSYADYIGLPDFPDIPQEEVEKIDPEELAKRMVRADDQNGDETLGSLYNEDWEIQRMVTKVN